MVTQEMIDNAKSKGHSVYFSISSKSDIFFGHYKLTLIYGHRKVLKQKHVNDWKNKSIDEINAELNNQEWKIK